MKDKGSGKASVVLVVTPGDPDGIGPEIVWKTLRQRKSPVPLLCVGSRAPFDALGAPVVEFALNAAGARGAILPPRRPAPFVWLLPAPTQAPKGRLLPGFQSGWSIQRATELALAGRVAGLVTGPISKERLQKGGYPYPGHTEFLAELCSAGEVTMMLANEQLRVSLVTTHLPLSEVPAALTRPLLRRTILRTAEYLTRWWKIRRPRIAVAGLNPHAGEGGLFGNEEIRVISPVIKTLQKEKQGDFELFGPLPADTLFAKHWMARQPGARGDRPYDAVVCMFHDQGLIPVKLLDFPNTVNITLGLPILRTSVDHGTGFDIAGKGLADPSSLQSAIQLAAALLEKRKK